MGLLFLVFGNNLRDLWIYFRKSYPHVIFTYKPVSFFVLSSTSVKKTCSHRFVITEGLRILWATLAIHEWLVVLKVCF